MSLKSMTGFGRAEYKSNGFAFEVLVKGVNNRFTEYSFKMPPLLGGLEPEIRAEVQSVVGRGKVTVIISGNFEDACGRRVYFDRKTFRSYLDLFKSVGVHGNGSGGGDIRLEALKLPGVVRCELPQALPPAVRRQVLAAVRRGLKSFQDYRAREGRKITTEFRRYLKTLSGLQKRMCDSAAGAKRAAETHLRGQLKTYSDMNGAVRDRIDQDVSALLNRLDISEECSRLGFHLQEFDACLNGSSNGTCGRKMEFVLQEIHRELNTIGSKGQDPLLSRIVVEAKDYVERIREQVQNVE